MGWSHSCAFLSLPTQAERSFYEREASAVPTVVGQRARDFVRKALAEVPFVVLTTTKQDKYDRYLSDVFYLPGGTDPQEVLYKVLFLNQQLLDRGLAVRFDG